MTKAFHISGTADPALVAQQSDIALFIENARAELKSKGVNVGEMTPRELFDAVNNERASKVLLPLIKTVAP